MERTDPAVARGITPEKFQAQHNQIQSAINTLKKTLAEVKPDVTVIISDDQDELLFEDLMPAFSVYWGDTFPLVPYPADKNSGPVAKALANGWGDIPLDVPVDTDLGRHIIEYMIESDFDIAHSRYIRPQSGGAIARRYPTLNGESTYVRVDGRAPLRTAPWLELHRQAHHEQRSHAYRADLPERIPAQPAHTATFLRLRASPAQGYQRLGQQQAGGSHRLRRA